MSLDNSTQYIQTKYDKTIIESIEFLVSNKRKFGIPNQKAILDKIGVSQVAYSQIRKKQRGFTKADVDGIMSELESYYQISPNYLRTGKGEIMLKNINQLNDSGQAPATELELQLQRLEVENEHLKKQLADKEKIIATQEMVLEVYKNKFN